MAKGSWTKLGQEKLASSGLTTAIADKLGMYEIASAVTLDKAADARTALIIPYRGFDGTALSPHPRWPGFFRGRYLSKPTDFKSVADKEQRYFQPPRSGVCAYFPSIVDWKRIIDDTSEPLFITEGEFKAAAACTMEYYTIGLGGVWNFKSMSDGTLFLPELERINWVKRVVYITYDSDFREKPQICNAINGLAEELQERGALVRVLMLPPGDEGQKVGLDDYFLENSKEDFESLMMSAEPLGVVQALWTMNKEVVYVEDPGLIIDQETGLKMSPAHFKEHSRWATDNTTERSVNKEGDITMRKVPAAPVWVRWPLRKAVKRVTYRPGLPRITEEAEYNQWKGWGAVPRKGSVDLWLKLTQYIFQDAEPGVLDYFYDWCAFPIQNPGVKMFSAVLIHGRAQGTGKTLIGYHLGKVYGTNFKEIHDKDLEETFWAENKQFVLGDEISGSDNRQYSNALKRLITQENFTINIKFVPQFTIPDCINYLFTSQHADSFFIEDKDRRYLVNEVTADPLPEEFYLQYDEWYKRGDGAAALMHWLLERKISKKFNPYAPPPRTAAKERMIMHAKGDLASWVHDLIKYPDQNLKLGAMAYSRDLFTSKEILGLYTNNYPNNKVTAVGMGRALAAAGAHQADGGRALRNAEGKMDRYFAVRNIDVWKKSTDRKKMEKNIAMQPVGKNK